MKVSVKQRSNQFRIHVLHKQVHALRFSRLCRMFYQIALNRGLTLGIVQAFGVMVGGKIAHALPRHKLRLVVAFTLVGVGLLMIGRTIL